MKTKKAILTTVFLTLCVLTFSQTQLVYETNNHMKFNGISMDGNMNDFIDKLVKQGYTVKESGQNIVTFNAEIIGKPCEIVVNGTVKSNTIYMISIMLPPGESWQSIKEDYNKIKNLYTKDLGVGIFKEYFSAPYTDGDGKEMEALSSGKIDYKTYWKSESGIIMVSILDKEVFVVYQDKTNNIIAENEMLEKKNK